MVSNGSHVEGADFVREESKSLEGIATYSHESSSGPHRGRQPWGQLFLCREHQQCTIHSKLLNRFLKYSLPPSALYSMLMPLLIYFPPIMLILNINFKGGKSNSLFKVIFKINRYKWFASFYTVEIHSKPVILTLRSAKHWLLHDCCNRWCCLCKDAFKTHKSVKHTLDFFQMINCKNWLQKWKVNR